MIYFTILIVCVFSPFVVSTTPISDCDPVCLIYCAYGNVLDDKGCPTCKCKQSPCGDGLAPLDGYSCGGDLNQQQCPSDSECVIGNGDVNAVCCPLTKQPLSESTPITSISDCGPVCAIYCQYGNVLDDKGCPTCKCKQSPCGDGLAPLKGYSCGGVFNRQQCPFGSRCIIGRGDKSGVCCPRIKQPVTESTTRTTKPGSCPIATQPPGTYGICIARCSTDIDCPGFLKCCGGCPRDCVAPVV
jgi:hypothetical protein